MTKGPIYSIALVYMWVVAIAYWSTSTIYNTEVCWSRPICSVRIAALITGAKMEKESPSPVAILLICMHVVFLLFSYLSSPCTTSTDVYVVYIHRVKCFKLLRKLSKISTLLVKSFLFFCKWKLHGFPFCPFVEWIEDVYFFTCFTAFLVWASKIEFLQLQPFF